ncbi:MAG: PAN/Apple domain-containing protein [Candidatus Devosia symbiotica]|nr:PAN/Apple domain-containing protein [Candidatus Devosia symbiotica]
MQAWLEAWEGVKRRGLGIIRLIGVTLVLAFGMAEAQAADQKITLLQDTDLSGFNYAIVKNTNLDACSAGCADDNICQAFTFNQKSNWCLLKG